MATKQLAQRYFQEMNGLVKNITSVVGGADTASIERLVKLLKIGGLSDGLIKSIYLNCGFNSWNEYVQAKRNDYFSSVTSSKVSCVDDKLWIAAKNIQWASRDVVKEFADEVRQA